MSEDFLRDLVQDEREALVPSAGAKKRTWKRVSRSVAIGAPISGWPANESIAAKLTASWGKGLMALVLGGAATVGVWRLAEGPETHPAVARVDHDEVTPKPRPKPASAAAVQSSGAPPPVGPPPSGEDAAAVDPPVLAEARDEADPTPDVEEPTAARPARRRSSDAAAEPRGDTVTGSDLAEEARLLADARRDLQGGSPRAALSPLAEHARRFPRGQLLEERLALRARAWCRAGDLEQGRREGAVLRDSFPSSSQLTRVAHACDVP